MLVQIIKKVPSNLFKSVLDQINTIDWSSIEDDDYVKSFRDKSLLQDKITPLFLRSPKVDNPNSNILHPREWASSTECIDNPKLYSTFDSVNLLSKWIQETVGGESIGHIYLNSMPPGGGVGLHVDPLDYFNLFTRFHVPLKTNLSTTFWGPDNAKKEHMPLGYLCRLNNLLPHQVFNHGNEIRIHLIVDVLVPGGNKIF